MKKYDAIIIGGGPAGMMAAVRASQRGRNVALLESNDSLGKKLLISGNGRCNVSNVGSIEDFLNKFSPSGVFLRNAFAKFFNSELIEFFVDEGVGLKTEGSGRVFPRSSKAEDILSALNTKLKDVQVLCNERVKEIIFEKDEIRGVVTHSGKNLQASHVLISTGGLSYPETGSSGDGYDLAKRLGHKIVPTKPALVPLIVGDESIKEWQGISLSGVGLALYADAKKIKETKGDLIFTHFGLSGPAVFGISAAAFDTLEKRKDVTLSINFKPEWKSVQEADTELLRYFNSNSAKDAKNVLGEFMPKRLTDKFLKTCGVSGDKVIGQVTAGERKNIAEGLLGFKLNISGVKPLKDAIVTRGGVNTKEIDPKTMESRIIKGLFFAGEVIDVDAGTGGYNMQAAFSTGWAAGDNL